MVNALVPIPDSDSTRKANQWHFGMKAHIGTDTQGYVHSVEVTAANVHDVTMMEQCLHGEEKEIYGDKGYACRKRKEQADDGCVARSVPKRFTGSASIRCRTRDTTRVTEAKLSHNALNPNTLRTIRPHVARYADQAMRDAVMRLLESDGGQSVPRSPMQSYTATTVSVSPASRAFMYARIRSRVR